MNHLETGTNTIAEIDKDKINAYLAWRATTPINGTIELSFDALLDTSETYIPAWSKINHWFVPELALDELYHLYQEYSVENWDGYGAVPISETAYREAETLVRLLPSFVPAPDILPEPDGGIGLDWDKGANFSFTISVTGNHVLAYAGLFGENNETYGTENFAGNLPKAILDNLKRLFSAAE